jgi:hypothetical protein
METSLRVKDLVVTGLIGICFLFILPSLTFIPILNIFHCSRTSCGNISTGFILIGYELIFAVISTIILAFYLRWRFINGK